jgi:DNA-binding transcriptional MerR regulator
MATQGEFFEVPHVGSSVPEISDLSSNQPPRIVGDSPSIEKSEAPHKAIPRGMKDLSIPKLYYSISEVSRLTGLEQYVLRYWETEFDELRPQKNRAGNRIYSNKDIKFILKIRELLREKRYTIEGAKQILHDERSSGRAAARAKNAEAKNGESMLAESEEVEMHSEPADGQLTMIAPEQPSHLAISKADLDEIKSALQDLRAIFSPR